MCWCCIQGRNIPAFPDCTVVGCRASKQALVSSPNLAHTDQESQTLNSNLQSQILQGSRVARMRERILEKGCKGDTDSPTSARFLDA